MASGSAVLAPAAGLPLLGHRRRFGLTGKDGVKQNKLFRSWKQLVLLRKITCFVEGNKLFPT